MDGRLLSEPLMPLRFRSGEFPSAGRLGTVFQFRDVPDFSKTNQEIRCSFAEVGQREDFSSDRPQATDDFGLRVVNFSESTQRVSSILVPDYCRTLCWKLK